MAVLALIPVAAYAGAAAGAAATAAGAAALSATIATSVVSGAILAAGSIVDQMFVFPALFGRGSQNTKGPRITDIQITTASYGSPMNFCIGRQNRTSGTIIWTSGVQQESHENSLGGKGGGNVTSYDYFIDIAIAWCEGPVNAVRKVWADGKLIYDEGVLDVHYDSIAHYTGELTQAADPDIQADQGIGNTPAYVGTCYTKFKKFKLSDWGNRIPNFTAMIEAQQQALLGDAIQLLWAKAGRDTAEIDTSWVRDVEVLGYTISGPQAGNKMIEPLLLAYDVVVQEQDGIHFFYHRKDMAGVAVNTANLAAAEEGTEAPDRPVKITDTFTVDLPSAVAVTYLDPATQWQQNSQYARRQSHPAPTMTKLDLPLTLDGNTARGIAQRALWAAPAERLSLSFTLPPSQLHIIESDAVPLSVDGLSFRARIMSVTKGNNYVYEIQAVSEQLSILTQAATADIPSLPPTPGPTGLQTHNVVIMDIPIMPADDYAGGFHYAVLPTAFGATWSGGRLYASLDDVSAAHFNELDTYRVEGTGGICSTTLPNGTDSTTGFWDNVTTLTIQMLAGTLSSQAELDVLNLGINRMYVGKNDGTGEVIAFCNALLVGSNTYTISKIMRGQLGTEDRMAGHVASEYAILLDAGAGAKLKAISDHIGRQIFYRAVPNHRKVGDILSVSATRYNRTLWPWSPVHIAGTRDGSNNLTITWLRRCNEWFSMISNDRNTAPEPFGGDAYNVYLYDNSGTLKRTVSVAGKSYTYTATGTISQTTDGITPGDPVKVIVKQLNQNLSINNSEGVPSALTTV